MRGARQAIGRLERRTARRRPRTRSLLVRRRDIWGGAVTLAGTRIPVYLLEDFYEEVPSVETMLKWYPGLTRAQLCAALTFARRHPTEVRKDRDRQLAALREVEAELYESAE